MAKNTTNKDRRRAIKKSAALAGCALCGSTLSPLLSGCESDKVKTTNKDVGVEFDITSEPALAQVGGAAFRIFDDYNEGRNVLIIRLSEDKFSVLTSVCPHQGCQVNLPTEAGADIVCPCHSSKFSPEEGSVKQGPSEAPLKQYANTLNANKTKLTIIF